MSSQISAQCIYPKGGDEHEELKEALKMIEQTTSISYTPCDQSFEDINKNVAIALNEKITVVILWKMFSVTFISYLHLISAGNPFIKIIVSDNIIDKERQQKMCGGRYKDLDISFIGRAKYIPNILENLERTPVAGIIPSYENTNDFIKRIQANQRLKQR